MPFVLLDRLIFFFYQKVHLIAHYSCILTERHAHRELNKVWSPFLSYCLVLELVLNKEGIEI